ncbi:MAG: tetratricopeptide repeat protein [Planctomycetota bacterium]|nr:MAG: tetratricopeptide repeat protein [Planctomycetota bacterium]
MTMLHRIVLGTCLCLGACASGATLSEAEPAARGSAPAPHVQELAPSAQQFVAQGEAAFAAQDWTTAASHFQRATVLAPSDLRAWVRLGYCRHMLKDYARAIEAYERVTSGPGVSHARYNTACALALQGKTEPAFAALTAAVEAGFDDRPTFESDTDLASLRGDPRFAALAARVGTAMTGRYQPPPEARQFDFWVGEWDVYTATGARAGSSVVESILNGCVVLENWQSAQGGAGKSFNRYDARRGEWRQHWVDDTGNELDFSGAFADGCMSIAAKLPQPDGRVQLRRMRFFDLPGAEVRQWGEISTDDGASWTTEYDLYYRPKAKS